jgi:hypothetical protein
MIWLRRLGRLLAAIPIGLVTLALYLGEWLRDVANFVWNG